MMDQIEQKNAPDAGHEDQARAESLAALNAGAVHAAGVPDDVSNGEGGEVMIPTADLLLPAVSLICDKAAPLWGITQQEKAALSDAYGKLLDHYFPGLMQTGPIGAVVVVTAAVVVPRLGTPRLPEQVQNAEGEASGANQ